ncbi:MAG: GNAT family N-acetyltransferase [Pseudomonadota bacterium]
MSLVRAALNRKRFASLFKILSSLNANLEVINPPKKPVLNPNRIFKKINDQLTICRMDASDMHYAMSTWSLQEKWTPTQHTIEPFLAADTNGYYMLFADNEPVGSLAAICYHQLKLAFLGLFLVDKNHRQKGYSKILWDNIVPDIQQQGYTLGLNASPYASLATPKFYEKLGFKEAHTDQAWQLTENKPLTAPDMPQGCEIVAIETDELLDQVVAYDSRIFGQERKDFISRWMMKPDTFTFAALTNGKVTGYIVASLRVLPLEPDKKSYRIGALFADNEACASGLVYNALQAVHEARPVVIDLPGNNIPVASKVMQGYGFNFFYNSVHMFTDPALQTTNDEKVYGKSSLTIAHR